MRSHLIMRNALTIHFACLLIACASPALGQGREGDAEKRVETAPRKKKKKAARSPATSEQEEKNRRRLWLSASLSTVFDSNVEHDERRLRSFGLVPSFGFHFRDNPERPSFEAEYEVGFHRYTRTDGFDRVSQYFTGAYRRRLPGRLSSRTT